VCAAQRLDCRSENAPRLSKEQLQAIASGSWRGACVGEADVRDSYNRVIIVSGRYGFDGLSGTQEDVAASCMAICITINTGRRWKSDTCRGIHILYPAHRHCHILLDTGETLGYAYGHNIHVGQSGGPVVGVGDLHWSAVAQGSPFWTVEAGWICYPAGWTRTVLGAGSNNRPQHLDLWCRTEHYGADRNMHTCYTDANDNEKCNYSSSNDIRHFCTCAGDGSDDKCSPIQAQTGPQPQPHAGDSGGLNQTQQLPGGLPFSFMSLSIALPMILCLSYGAVITLMRRCDSMERCTTCIRKINRFRSVEDLESNDDSGDAPRTARPFPVARAAERRRADRASSVSSQSSRSRERQDVIQQLNMFIYDPTGQMQISDKICCVCLAEFESGDKLRKLPCHHDFHAECIASWLHINMKCPLCIRSVSISLPSESSGSTPEVDDVDTDMQFVNPVQAGTS
jgi:hypothetical protein